MTGPRFLPAAGHAVLTPLYDLAVGTLTPEKRMKAALVRQARIEPGHVVVDVACGTGTLLLGLADAHPDALALGVDVDAEVLAIARAKAARRGTSLRLVRGTADALPLADASVDRVLTSVAVHHLTTDGKLAFFREARRVLRPGGSLHVMDFGPAHSTLMRWTQKLLQAVDGASTVADNLDGRLPSLVIEAGFPEAAVRGRFATAFGSVWLWEARRA